MRRFASTIAAMAALVLGCDGGEQPGRTVTAPANSELRVVGSEYAFDPATIVLLGAGRATLTLRNDGSLAHNLKLFRGDEELGGTATLPAGGSGSALVNLEHGNYEMVCTVGDHAELGMTGTLRVR